MSVAVLVIVLGLPYLLLSLNFYSLRQLEVVEIRGFIFLVRLFFCCCCCVCINRGVVVVVFILAFFSIYFLCKSSQLAHGGERGMKKYTSQGKQRYHRHRDVVVPHGFISGFLLSINPFEECRALREAQCYFNNLTEELQSGQNARLSRESTSIDSLKATSTLLAAELENAIQEHQLSRKRRRSERDDAKNAWFSSIDIACKGFLLLRVPMINPDVTCSVVQVYGSSGESVGHSSLTEENSSRHTIMINPLVSHLVDLLFHDLKANPRPVFRHCFRLTPVELTCCPVIVEMKLALEHLLKKHFLTDKKETDFKKKFDEPFGFSKSLSRKKTLLTVLFSLSVKNNTKVKESQREITENLLRLFPLNKFTVVRRESGEIDAAVQVVVAQSTCLMGVQRCYSERSHFNVGEISRGAFSVDSMLQGTTA